MWADDSFWLPLMLEGRKFQGRILCDGDVMLRDKVTMSPER
jgi:hypothetical protein